MYFYYLFLMLCASVFSQSCPLRCPACTKCDSKKGTCTEPRDFVLCSKGGVSGVCFAGTCNTGLSLSTVPVPKCKTYRCPVSGQCNLVTAPDGSDCTPNNVEYESVCLGGVCNRVWLGLGEEFPLKNVGCKGRLDGLVCDTNHNLIDGETCQGGLCKFVDGTYYGYV